MEIKRGIQLGPYELVLRIGRGGMATVWIARERRPSPDGDRLVAVKVMLTELAQQAEFVGMFRDEVQIIKMIRHPAVVDVYQFGEQSGVTFMGMEWVEGDSLHALIAEAGKRRAIPSEIAVRIIAEAASGLHAAHELRDEKGIPRNVVHRDVSPHNILIGINGGVKLVDFGVAKAVGRLSEQTRVGQLKGKFSYMSPEQARGRGVDRRSDIFSLGIVLYELTSNRRLFRGENDVETLRLVMEGQIPKPTKIVPGYPPELERIVMRALERDVESRYRQAADLERDLNQYLKAERIVVPRSGVAGLLKRVMGEKIEQRRKAVRRAIKTLGTEAAGANSGPPELLPTETAFTPTGANPITVTGFSQVSKSSISSLSQVGHPPPSGTGSHFRAAAMKQGVVLLPYAIGLAALGLALATLWLLWQRDRTASPSIEGQTPGVVNSSQTSTVP